jgi:hypothetical protein
MSGGPKWLGLIGPHGSAEADRLAAIQRCARAAGLSVRWRRVGNKWSGKGGFKWGHIEVVRGVDVVGHVSASIGTPWADDARTVEDVRRALDQLERLVAEREARGDQAAAEAWAAKARMADADKQMLDAARSGRRAEVERLKPGASAEGGEKAENILLGVEAAARGDQEAVDAWAARQGFTDEQRELLLWSVGLTTDAMARLFIAIADDVNVRDEHRRTPLMCAAEYERLDIMRMLIDAGTDIEAIDKAMIRARMDGHDRAAELLKPYASAEGRQGAEDVVGDRDRVAIANKGGGWR